MDRALREWLERYIEARLIRVQRGNDFTQELIRRSHKQIAISQDLLSRKVPKVWHPEPPQMKQFVVGQVPVECNSKARSD
jgi:hypothetical protein